MMSKKKPSKKVAQGKINMSSEKDPSNKAAQFLGDAFEGIKGRQPKSDHELSQWLATDEGKEATLFDGTTLSLWGERGRS